MPETLQPILTQLRELMTRGRTLRRAIGTGRQRHTQPPWRRVELRLVQVRRSTALQITTFGVHQSHTRQCALGPEAEREAQALLDAGFAHWHVETDTETWQLRITKRGEAQLHRSPLAAAAPQDLQHNRDKERLIPADDPLWQALGMTDGQGAIKPTAQNKYRQVDAFLRLVAPLAVRLASTGGSIDVVDLGCGNAALTFAAYRYLTDRCHIEARLTGVDIKTQARERNSALARELGYEQVRFVAGSIAQAQVPRADLVLALHACDTATDEALARAIGWRAQAILAAPCCHHHLQKQMHGCVPPAPFNAVMRHGILAERWADVLTDSLRAAILRQQGYRTEVIEFIPSQHTPRNTLLRAQRTMPPPDAKADAEYYAMRKLWRVEPYLATLLGAP